MRYRVEGVEYKDDFNIFRLTPRTLDSLNPI